MFGERFTELRKKEGYSQADMAQKLDVSMGAVAMWETNKRVPKHDTLLKIADYFNVSVDYLLGRADTQKMVYERLQSAREEARKTQTEVANILGITRQAYNHYETGKREPSLDTISKLATLYGVSVDYLLGKTDTKKEGPAEADPIGYDDFGYAMYMEGRELTEENKAKLLEMAKFFKQQQEKENEKAK